MRRNCVWVIVLLGLLAAGPLCAENGGEYPNGVEGIKGGSVPGPGVYLRTYFFDYQAETLMDGDGKEAPVGFDVNVFALAPRLIWVTKKKVLGADVAFDVMVPILRTDLQIEAMRFDRSTTGVGDVYFSPLILSWHKPKLDSAVGLSFFAPTGSWSETNPTEAGKNYWTTMLTAGTTVYLDPGKTWSAAVLGRYEHHFKRIDQDVTLGDDFHFEWGLARTYNGTLDVGLAGYAQWQVTEDSGTAAADASVKDRVFAVGPEISKFYPKHLFGITARALYEFGARDRSRGMAFNVTVLKGL